MDKGSLDEAQYHAFIFLQSGCPDGADRADGFFAGVGAKGGVNVNALA
ncbi:hypothetical protein KXD93_28400 [Mucilaginibacter sp. BJC16-A38]|nr:hypothetical protein [Mucilaginibacter phenanthrenivorans]MCR8561609.1 hypothetical protein [Mucilaginibacter phenanthrenivorans]